MTPLLRVRDLAVAFRGEDGPAATVVEDMSFDLAAGEALGVLGESGCGKTTLGLALLGLLPPGGRVIQGEVVFRDRDLLRLREKELAGIRGDDISVVVQEPGIALSPCLRVGDQVADVVRSHRPWSRRRCRAHAVAMLEQVRLVPAGDIFRAYPHQLSGGQRQRVVIAQALACQPALMIADEPTAALDTTTQARIVALLLELKERLGLALFFISHDAALLATLADRVLVMYGGQLVEIGSCEQVYGDPSHPYTRELLRCAPQGVTSCDNFAARDRLPVIAGAPPDPARWPQGCRFEPRCPDRLVDCASLKPAMQSLSESHSVRCLKYGS